MKVIKGKKSIVLLVAGAIVAVGIAGGSYYFSKDKKSNGSNQPTLEEQTQEAIEKDVKITDIETESVDKIIADSNGDSEVAYGALFQAAMQKNYVGNSEAAISYYKAAAGLSGISEEWRDEANISIYYLAKKLNDKEMVSEYEALLGDKISDQANLAEGRETQDSGAGVSEQ